ncbi:hypothetical protein PI125_g23301 [Phytophthora idaei]|nr:hypothetical protein PI125_g23301 [Phytophthora idaei]
MASTSQDLTAWTSRTLIHPRQRRAVELQATPVAPTTPTTPPANFTRAPDAVAISDFVLQWQSVVRFVRDAIASAIDRQKENTDRRSRKSTEVFAVGDDLHARPTHPSAGIHRTGRGGTRRDGSIPDHRQYLVRLRTAGSLTRRCCRTFLTR